MSLKAIEDTLSNAIEYNSSRDHPYGEYHSSEISGCPLKTFLDKMVELEQQLNRWLFNGSAVHYYLQNNPNLLDRALSDAGFHPLDTDYEVETHHHLSEDVWLSGRCDIMTHQGGKRSIIDIKYSSIPPHSGHGRIYKYMSQVNTYAHMFNADEYGLLMINSKSNHIPDDIVMLTGEPNEDNWELNKQKAFSIHHALEEYGYPDGTRWEQSDLEERMDSFWEEVMELIDKDNCPSYEKECQYCDHSSYCPVKQGKLGGLRGLGK